MTAPSGGQPDLVALFDDEARALYHYLARRLGEWAAEDALSQTFLIAHQNRATFDPAKGPPRAWLYGIASRVVHRHRRDEARRLRAYARVPLPPAAGTDEVDERATAVVDAQAAYRDLTEALHRLDGGDRDVLLLFAWAQLTYEEIATALDIPVGTVRSRLHRARRRLRAGTPENTTLTRLEPHHG